MAKRVYNHDMIARRLEICRKLTQAANWHDYTELSERHPKEHIVGLLRHWQGSTINVFHPLSYAVGLFRYIG